MLILALGTLLMYGYHSMYFDLDKPVLPQGTSAAGGGGGGGV